MPFSLPIRRPVATAMVFSGLVLLGVIGWLRIPVELIPALAGDELYVTFFRPGSEPELVERELLMPLEAQVKRLPGVSESWGEVTGSAGNLRVRFEPGADLKVRELEMQRLAADLARAQPQGTSVVVSAQDLTVMSRFVMVAELVGGDDRNALRHLADEMVVTRLQSVPGVSRVLASGGAAREVTVRVDPDRCAALGVSPTLIAGALERQVQRLVFLGGVEDEAGRALVMLDGRPEGVQTLGEVRVSAAPAVLLRHVAEVELGVGREDTLFRVNGQPSVGLVVFQEQGANLVSLGRQLRKRIGELERELEPYGVQVVVGFDAAEMVERQLDRLKRLALSGFVIALAVLYLFLRSPRAVAVVAVAVPVSLLTAAAFLYVGGLTLNLITLFGLAVGIGMLVDNSIVVYEAVQRLLERGVDADSAAVEGVRRTVRAMVASTATNAVVFLPLAFTVEAAVTRATLKLLAVALLLPLGASLLVAVGLVPLLARWLAAPAALARLAETARRRDALAGLVRPELGRELFGGVLKVALRRPAGWLAGVAAAVLVTVAVGVPWLTVGTATREAAEADEVRLEVTVPRGGSLDSTAQVFATLEQAARALPGVKLVESVIQEEGGSLTVRLEEAGRRPAETTVGRVRGAVRAAARKHRGVEVQGFDGGGGGGGGGVMAALLGGEASQVVVSGPDAEQLGRLARDIEARLESIPSVAEASTSVRPGQEELRVVPDRTALAAHGLTPDQVLPALAMVRREGFEMRTGLTDTSGREVPLVIRSVEDRAFRARDEIASLRLQTTTGVIPIGALAAVLEMPPPAVIVHHNGRREVTVSYRLGSTAPQTGPARLRLDEQIRDAVREVHRPPGTTVEAGGEDETTSWFRRTVVPILLLLFATLAVTFESFTLPVVVLLSVPLTVIGAIWALALAGLPADLMALVGAVALLGLTVNPAILLVDRMQQRVRSAAWGAGAAALAAVRERTRPVLMTTATTVAGLWPLALATGRENEIWPPFATVLMGGLVTSTLLTLLVIPAGYVLLARLDRVLGRLGPYVSLGWVAATTAIMAPLIASDTISSLTWQVVTTLLVAAGLLGAAVLALRRDRPPEPEAAAGPPAVEVRFLQKVYGRPGPIGRALRVGERFAERVLARGGRPFDPRDARERAGTLLVVGAGAVYLAVAVQGMWWRLVFSLVAAALVAWVLVEVRRARGSVDVLGRVLPGGPENLLARLAPWVVLAWLAVRFGLEPHLAGERVRLPWLPLLLVAGAVAVVQAGRGTARGLAAGRVTPRAETGPLRPARSLWRRWSRRLFGFDLPREEIVGLDGVHLRVEGGMVGVLGPNGAGKTTLLRILAGILDPSVGTVTLGGVPVARLRRHLARWVGYLPQDFGLPGDLTAREYLDYYALLYGIRPPAERRQRVEGLLADVGLAERAGERISSYSGGMRQRVAVARTLLRLPSVIIVDEPTVGLDPRERIRFRNLLGRLAEGRVVLFSTHVVEDVAVACRRVVVLARGAVVWDGEPGALAEAARGRVWEAHLEPAGEAELPDDAVVVDRVPEEDGRVRLRLLCGERPHPEARPADPTLQDGYLVLVGSRLQRSAA